MDTGSAQIPVDIVRQNNKATTSTAEPPESPTFAQYQEPAFYDDEKVTKPPPNTKKTKDQLDPKRRSSRRPFQPHFQTGDVLTKEGDSSRSGLSTTTCHDIIQSKWLYDTNDPEREKVFLTSKTDSDFADFRKSSPILASGLPHHDHLKFASMSRFHKTSSSPKKGFKY